MTDIRAGDLVIAIPIANCSLGHPEWQEEWDNPEMDRRAYMVTWSGFSAYWKRPILAVAGRRGHFCAGCFVKQARPEPAAETRTARRLQPVS
jgi:hypothetical protein